MSKERGVSLFTGFKRWQFGSKKQLAFLEDLYVLVNDGIPANRAIEMMAQLTRGLTRDVAMNVAQKISEGSQLADGMRGWFAPNIVEIIRVGETGGALAQTMKSAITALSQRGAAVGAFAGALAYPFMVIGMACSVIVYLNTSVFDQFRAMKPESEWPEAGQRLVTIAVVVQHWWWLVIVAGIMICIVFSWLMRNYTGMLRSLLDQYPPFSFYRTLVAARLLETLGLLVANGVVFKSALSVMRHQASPYLSSHLFMMETLLSTGKTNIADVLATGLVGEDDLVRLKVMAEVKGLEHGLVRMGVKGAEEATKTMKTIARMIGGLMLALGGYLILSIMQGIYLTGMAMGAG